MFAGSGALGFEALSRGAKKVTCIEKNKILADALQANATTLGTQDIIIHNAPFETQADHCAAEHFDFIFCDPPFDQPTLIKNCHAWLLSYLKTHKTTLYLELPPQHADPFLNLPQLNYRKVIQTSSYVMLLMTNLG